MRVDRKNKKGSWRETKMKRIILTLLAFAGIAGAAIAQDYIGPAATPAKPRPAPPAAKPAPAPVAQGQAAPPAAGQSQPAPSAGQGQAPGGAAQQQVKMDINENFGEWVLQCWKQQTKACQILQREVEAKTQKTILITTISAVPDKNYRLMLLTPLGLRALPALPLVVDNSQIDVPMQSCITNGCVHVVELTSPQLAKLQGANDISLTLTALNGQRFGMKVPVKGLKEALGKMSQYLKS
jgi:invasion protein IalB